MKEFSIIVAMDEKSGIGKDGGLPWKLSKDMLYFKDVTTKAAAGKMNAVVMGRKTWESIPEKFRPLPDRLNVVLTRDQSRYFGDDVLKAQSLDEALTLIEQNDCIDHVFLIGGAQVYHDAVGHELCGKMYITRICDTFECDAFFPEVPEGFVEISNQGPFVESGLTFSFLIYCKECCSKSSN